MAQSKPTARRYGGTLSDNLAISAGFEASREATLVRSLDEWLEDRHPSLAEAGYVLHLFSVTQPPRFVSFFPESRKQFNLQPSIKSINGRYGAHGPFCDAGFIFLDLASAATPLTVGRNDRDGDESQIGRTTLPEVIDEAQRTHFEDLCARALEEGRCQIVYRVPTLSALAILARKGGTGLLEDYPRSSDIRERVHKRNLALVRNCKFAYEVYVKSYVQRVGAVDGSASDAEVKLREIGPPEAPYVFPWPAGAEPKDYEEIIDQGATSAFNAWQAIRAKLDEIWGIRSAGRAWLTCDFTMKLDKSKLKTPIGDFGATATLKVNFEADDTGKMTVGKGASEVKLLIGLAEITVNDKGVTKKTLKVQGALEEPGGGLKLSPAVSLGEDGSATLDFGAGQGGRKFGVGVSIDKDRLVTEVRCSFGIYDFKMDQYGSGTVKVGPFFASQDRPAGTMDAGVQLDLKDLVGRYYTSRGAKVPDWIDTLPDLALTVAGHFQASRTGDSDIMRFVARAPGLWDLRPREEFGKLGWDSLDADEQRCLELLSFDKRRWDYKLLPETTTKPWVALGPDQMMATFHLPVPSTDPQWVQYWSSLAKRAAVGDVTVSVRSAQNAPVSGASVRLYDRRKQVDETEVTGASGEALFAKVPVGGYVAAVGEEGAGESRSATQNVTVIAGANEQVGLLVGVG